MFRLRPALWPTLISLPIFVVSLGLGIWQMERREWKRDILDRIDGQPGGLRRSRSTSCCAAIRCATSTAA